ncbi:peptidoglycan-binding domain-containing protein [Kitasatospora sp. CB01950]|uniref:peptidoglycan-binding domain-containing protein n=1 Tax=Kitasatospora sp. CB01950 TaxID=1703930 RepID=UPI00093C026E|nr:peptidoglycan-binding domain-containing protein [Kitasatospora sp. CB01950]OKJ10280.1 hypothetical protein AMK19_15520 [Kitasatospora sp. CB01950]
MSADRCPRCGTAGPAGSCACAAVSPVEQTVVLPPLDGPHLVRPYVAGTPVVGPGDPAGDPFATRIGSPSVQPITHQLPVPEPQFTPPQPAAPFAPPPATDRPDAAATQLLPPVPPQGAPAPGRFVQTDRGVPFPLGRVAPPPPNPIPQQPQPEPPTALLPPIPAGPEPATALLPPVPAARPPATDLGMFGFHDEESAAPVSRTERRSQRRRSADRKRLVIAGGAVGVTALAASLAMLLSSSPSSTDHALPAPTGPAVASTAESTPSAEASPDATASSAAPSPTRSSARPSQTVVTQPAAAPVATAPATDSPSAPPTTQPPSSTPSRTLQRDDTGPDVVQLQRLLMTVGCNRIGDLTLDRASNNQLGFGYWTENALATFQQQNRNKLKNITKGVYDPQTRALLESMAQNPNC